MFYSNPYGESLDFVRVKQETVSGNNMGQYFHDRWWQWSFLVIESAKGLIIGWKFSIDSGWAEEVQGNVKILNKFAPFDNGKSGWVDAMTDRKWSLQVWIDFLEELRECFYFVVNWYAASLAVVNYLRRL